MIELNPRDLHIKKSDAGNEFVSLKGGTAFDEAFIEECRGVGVKDEFIKEEE